MQCPFLSLLRGRIDFDGVSFAYRPSEPVLHDIELTVMAWGGSRGSCRPERGGPGRPRS